MVIIAFFAIDDIYVINDYILSDSCYFVKPLVNDFVKCLPAIILGCPWLACKVKLVDRADPV